MLEPGAARAKGLDGRRGTRRRGGRRLHRQPPEPRPLPQRARRSAARTATALRQALDDPQVRAALRCGPLSAPNHKLIPDVRWVADCPSRPSSRAAIPPSTARIRHGVALYVSGRYAMFRQASSAADDDPLDAGSVARIRRDRHQPLLRCLRAMPRDGELSPAGRARTRARLRFGWASAVTCAADRRSAAARSGACATAALRLQRRRERPLRAAGDRAVRPRLEPELLRQPARVHVHPARRLRGLVRRQRAACRTPSPRIPARSSSSRASTAAVLGTRRPCGCSTSPARGCSTGASGCSPPACWR